jgi:hypothetical protein
MFILSKKLAVSFTQIFCEQYSLVPFANRGKIYYVFQKIEIGEGGDC